MPAPRFGTGRSTFIRVNATISIPILDPDPTAIPISISTFMLFVVIIFSISARQPDYSDTNTGSDSGLLRLIRMRLRPQQFHHFVLDGIGLEMLSRRAVTVADKIAADIGFQVNIKFQNII
jgi:hypothetical protein